MNDLNIHIDNYTEEDLEDFPTYNRSELYRKNVCMYRHECTCTSCDYTPLSTSENTSIAYCTHCNHLHMIYMEDDTGMSPDLYGGLLFANIYHLLGLYYKDLIAKYIKTKEVAMWLIREREPYCILTTIIQITLIELHECMIIFMISIIGNLNIPLFTELVERLSQQVAMLCSGYKKSKKIEMILCYHILELHQLLQRIRYSIDDYDDKNIFYSLI